MCLECNAFQTHYNGQLCWHLIFGPLGCFCSLLFLLVLFFWVAGCRFCRLVFFARPSMTTVVVDGRAKNTSQLVLASALGPSQFNRKGLQKVRLDPPWFSGWLLCHHNFHHFFACCLGPNLLFFLGTSSVFTKPKRSSSAMVLAKFLSVRWVLNSTYVRTSRQM